MGEIASEPFFPASREERGTPQTEKEHSNESEKCCTQRESMRREGAENRWELFSCNERKARPKPRFKEEPIVSARSTYLPLKGFIVYSNTTSSC
jgi:hypothetical protein